MKLKISEIKEVRVIAFNFLKGENNENFRSVK